MTPLAAILALIVGLTLGLLGGGGSILTVPVIAFTLGVDPKTAIVMSLPIVGGASLIGVARHWKLGNIDFRIAIPFGAAAMVGAFGGARLARFIEGSTQLILLAVVMLGASISMFRNANLAEPKRPKVPMRQAVGTSLFVIVLNTVAGFAGYAGSVVVPWNLVLWFASFTAIGILAGSALAAKVSGSNLKRAFAVLLVLVAAYILWQSRSTF